MNGAAASDRLPLYVLTGFLGSGKTSLLRQCLRHPEFADTAVLVNEFGEIGLDHVMLDASTEETVVLPGGCVCCTAREDLAAGIHRLSTRRREGRIPPFSRLVIETSGVADLVPVITTLRSDPRVAQTFAYCGSIVTVDAVAGGGSLARHPESVRQVLYADRAVVTKCDLATAETIVEVEAAIRQINPAISIMHSAGASVSPAELTGDLRCDFSPSSTHVREWIAATVPVDESPPATMGSTSSAPAPFHVGRFRSFSWHLDYALDWNAFGIWLTMLLHAHGHRVLRVKGILNVSGADAPVAVHGVQHTVYPPMHLSKWHDQERRSHLVFIVDGSLPELLRESFDAFQKAAAVSNARMPDGAAVAVGGGRTIGGRPRRRPSAPAWIKG